MSEMIERVARKIAAKHYAARFGVEQSDSRVEMNVNANWRAFSSEVRDVIEAMRVPLLGLFEDHYWDSFENDKEIVLAHIKGVLGPILDEALK